MFKKTSNTNYALEKHLAALQPVGHGRAWMGEIVLLVYFKRFRVALIISVVLIAGITRALDGRSSRCSGE